MISPDMVMAAGQVLQRINPIQKAIFGGGGGSASKVNNAIQDQYALARQWGPKIFAADFRNKMELAEKYGINKLTMMGQPAAAMPGVSVPSGGGQDGGVLDGLSSIGEGFSRIRAGAQTTMEKLQERLLTAQIDGQEIENARRASELAVMQQPGNPPSLQTVPDNFYEKLSNTRVGIGAASPLFNLRITQDGIPVREFNTNDSDSETLQALSVPLMGMDYLHGRLRRAKKTWYNTRKRWAQRVREGR